MFKTIALCASLLVPAFALADEAQAPTPAAQADTAQPASTKTDTSKSTKPAKVRKTTKKGSQGRVGAKQNRASDSSTPAPSASGSVAK